MIIETKRLRIIPLDVEEFKALLQGMWKLEKKLGLNESKSELDENTQSIMLDLYKKIINYEDIYYFYTNWQIVLKIENISIGSVYFKGEPNEEGFIELGISLNNRYRDIQYMIEALKEICRWAKENNIRGIKTNINDTNEIMKRILIDTQFILEGKNGETDMFVIELNK